MEIKNWLVVGVLLVLVPGWIGSIWSYFADIKDKIKNLLFCWVAGFMTVMAVSQIILVLLVLRRFRFSHYTTLAMVLYGILMVAALVLNWIRFKQKKSMTETKGDCSSETENEKQAWNIWQVLFLVGALVLIFVQAFVAGVFQHIDDDDSRFVVEQVMAVEQGTMYTHNPVTGDVSYWDMGEVRKDMVSPWAMLVAFWCKISGIAPAILSHKYLPFYMILLCYAVYALIGMNLFKNDREKVCTFLIFASALNIFGYFSTHTVSAVMLLRIWQGKALVGALLVPVMFYIVFEIMSKDRGKMWYFLGAAVSTAAALASGSGITIIPVVIGISGIAEFIHTRKVKKTLAIWCMAIPSVIYLLCYLFFWQLLKVYF